MILLLLLLLLNSLSTFVTFDYNTTSTPSTFTTRDDYALDAFKAAKASRLPVDLGSRYGLSPKLTDRVPVLLISSRSCVAASVYQFLVVQASRGGLTKSRTVIPDCQRVCFPSESDLEIVVLQVSYGTYRQMKTLTDEI